MGRGKQLGLGPDSTSNRAVPTLIERLSWRAQGKEFGRVKQISSSSGYTLALLENNQVWIWGAAADGQSMTNRRIGWVSQ
jgi:alpha-tubulin suppressor-like RCC1 family protein